MVVDGRERWACRTRLSDLPRGDVAKLRAELARVRPGGPTNIVEAARAAARHLRGVALPTKLAVLITDGETVETTEQQETAFADLRQIGRAHV